MTERERLRELIYAWELDESKVSIADCDADESFERLIDRLLANGVIVPPCKVGDTVYSIDPCISQVFVGEVYEIFQSRYGLICRSSRKGYYSLAFPADSVGKTVFLTREEAEKALEERSGHE